MNATILLITPDMAEKYLQNMRSNRNRSSARVNAYARDMARGAWQENGGAIIFNESGQLVDGQHRLAAIVKSRHPQEMVVITDVADDVCLFDRGRSRSTSDTLAVGGMPKNLANSTNVGIVKLHYMLNGTSKISDDEVGTFILNHEDSLLAIRQLWTTGGHKNPALLSTKGSAFLLAALYAIENGEDINDIARFAYVYRTGICENKNESAAIVCRNDCFAGSINPYHGGLSDRAKSEMVFEKAMFDFCRKYPRTKSYKNVSEHTYTIPKWEQIKEDLS